MDEKRAKERFILDWPNKLRRIDFDQVPECGECLGYVNCRLVGVLLFQYEIVSQRFIEPPPQQDREPSGFLRWLHVHAEISKSVVRSVF